jgi:hypothetical protein
MLVLAAAVYRLVLYFLSCRLRSQLWLLINRLRADFALVESFSSAVVGTAAVEEESPASGVGKRPADADIAEASSVVPTPGVDADELAVNLTSNISFVTSYAELILAVEVTFVVVTPAMKEPQGAVPILL